MVSILQSLSKTIHLSLVLAIVLFLGLFFSDGGYGAFDQIFPLERSTRPAFELLGTPVEDKKFVIYESGHTLPPNDLIRESLDFLDRYFGPAN